jgi:TolA-binding protein
MLTPMLRETLKRSGYVMAALGCLIFALSSGVSAQNTPSALPISAQATSVLLDQAKGLLEANNPEALLPYLRELLIRMEGNQDDEARNVRSFCMYQIAVCQMQVKRFAEAADSFERFIKEYPKDSLVPVASLQVAESYAMGGKWNEVEKYSGSLLTNKTLDPGQRSSARKIYAEALYNQKKWAEATVPLLQIFDESSGADQADVRSGSAVMLVTCYAKAGDFKNLFKFLPYCGDNVRQEAGLNMALVESGDVKLRRAEYLDALVLYRMVFRKAELDGHYKKQIAALQKTLKEPYVSKIGSLRSVYDEKQRDIQLQLNRLTDQQKKISDGGNYDLDIEMRIAQCYAGLKRSWPAYLIYKHLYTDFPKEKVAEDSRFFAFTMLLDVREWDRAVNEGLGYVQHYPKGIYADEVTLNLMQAYLHIGKVDLAQEMGIKAVKMLPEHRFMDQVQYLTGYIQFQKQDYGIALNTFSAVFKKWPDCIYREACDYWMAMCRLFLGQFNEASAAFETYLNNADYKPAEFAEDASYRLGIARYGANQFEAAEAVFRKFIRDYPASNLRSEAYSMIGDLRGAEGDLDVALTFYAKGLDAAANIEQVNYAVFQTAKTYELQKNYQAIISLMESYIAERGAEGNFSGAGFWIGKAYKATGHYEKALETYVETVVRFGNRLENDDVDLILRELIKEYQSADAAAYRAKFLQSLNRALDASRNKGEPVLQLRLEALFVSITEGADRDRMLNEILSRNTIEDASPITLQMIAGEALARGNTAKVHLAYNRMMAIFQSSEFLLSVMNNEAEALLKDGRYEEVLVLAEEITNRFGYQADVGLTRLVKAQAYRELKRYEEAITTYKELFAIREWRGPLTPQALYWIGVCTENLGKPEEAFAFFQRVYVLYEGYTEWVVKSYEGSVRCLEKLKRTDDIIRTYQEMLSNEKVAATPEGARARRELDRLLPGGGKK